jgi:hypothetical protein
VRRKRRPWIGFALFALLAILGVFVLDGALAGVLSLAALITFILACINALRPTDRDDISGTQRTGLTGWLGGWW